MIEIHRCKDVGRDEFLSLQFQSGIFELPAKLGDLLSGPASEDGVGDLSSAYDNMKAAALDIVSGLKIPFTPMMEDD